MANALLKPGEVDIIFRYPTGRTMKLVRKEKIPFITLPDGSIRIRRDVVDHLIQDKQQGGDDAKN